MKIKNLLLLLFMFSWGLNAQAQCKAKMYYKINGNTVNFYGDSSTSAFTPNYFWNFGDGTSSTSKNPSHIYKNGTFSICLTINDTLNKCSDSVCTTITIFVPAACKANFAWTAYTPNGNKPIIMFSDSSYNVYSKFNFGDNTSHIRYRNMSNNIPHTYDSAGTYYVCLFVYDLNSKGDTVLCDSICKTVVISTPNCNAQFTHTVSGKTVTFRTTSTGKYKSIYWQYGDGQNYSRNADTNDSYTHTYSLNGKYIVYLHLYDSGNKTTCSYAFDTIEIKDSNSCKAKYTFTVSGDSVYFTNKSTGNWKSERWSMGDGKIIDQVAAPNYTFLYIYKCKGTYSPRLSIYENVNLTNNCSDFMDSVITKGVVGCNANYTSTINKNTVVFTSAATGSYCNEQWDFGDGTTAYYARGSATNATHTYTKLGTYTVCYKLYDNSGICSQTCKNIVISQLPGACKTSFTWSQLDCNWGDSTPSISFTPNNAAVKSDWYFGDGTSILGKRYSQVGHNYKTSGNYQVCLFEYVIDSKKDTVLCDSFCTTVNARSHGNIAKISSKIYGDTVVFTNISEGYWDKELWQFDDGTSSTTFTGKNGTISHVYKNNGNYYPALKIYDTNKKNLCTYINDTININVKRCQASFYLAIDTTTKFNLYLIQNSKGTTSNTKYFWSFGDGDTSHTKSPTHKYKSFGLYNLCLTITDSSKNCTSTYCDSIGLDSNGRLLKTQGFNLIVLEEKDILSAPNNNQLKQIQIYPNPSVGLVNISINSISNTPLTFEAYNALGQSIIVKQFEIVKGENQLEIDLSNNTKGIYFIHLRQGNQTITKRILLQNN
jgi:PKD repeat protein